ncbi:unnamed protein product [Candidula unifasciata]|uniref:G-protein coupled receptors family 1 profile domain-containing protein n=1 Tax=Candidula unifasciata TaxID=100452 RepID=A0A8S3ZYP3_9EUPU|nr:unnamed protein product [Candidula unifasciata]
MVYYPPVSSEDYYSVQVVSGRQYLEAVTYYWQLIGTTVNTEANLSTSHLQEMDTNVSLSICGTNSSDLWLMISPICSTRYRSIEIFLIVAVTLSLITLWTILGNILVLFALYRFETLRTMSNCLIGNLAISDLLLALTVLPVSIGHDLLGYWVFGEVACTVWLCVDVLYCTASIWGLCTVAFDRYLATVYPVWYHDQRSVPKAVGCIVFVWIFSVIISFAPFIGWRQMIPSFFTFNHVIRRHECILFTSSSYVLYSSMGSFVIPAVFMTFMYIRIFMVLHNQSKGIKTKVAATTTTIPTPADNGCPVIKLPSEEAINGDSRNIAIATFASGTADNLNDQQNMGEADSQLDRNIVLKIHHLIQPLQCSSVVSKQTESNLNRQTPLSAGNLRSNSFAIPYDATKAKSGRKHFLNVADLDRRNSHTATIQRSTSDAENMHVYMHELRLSPECHRSKSASALSTNEETDVLNHPSAPRRSLPCNISIFQRNNRMTMSMKRRFELREQRATKRMLLIMICFCVCWMPFLFMYILRSVCETCDMNHHFVAAIIWLGYVNSSLNPILYALFNDDFKTAFKKILGCAPLYVKNRRLQR